VAEEGISAAGVCAERGEESRSSKSAPTAQEAASRAVNILQAVDLQGNESCVDSLGTEMPAKRRRKERLFLKTIFIF
jgi:ABC-type dipeptide/oligopeptide/nickel transport system ATPase component